MTDENTTDHEQVWMRGYKTALVSMLQEILGKLGFDDPAAEHVKWIEERQRTGCNREAFAETLG